jgi:aromatic-amino-acid transaminase
VWTYKPSIVDPIVELMELYESDARADKVNLGIGVYQDNDGKTPIFAAVKDAEAILFEKETTKTYVGVGGDAQFVKRLGRFLFGDAADRMLGIQSVGGTGALRLIGEFCARVAPESRVWVSKPTWANHPALFASCGMPCESYEYGKYSADRLLQNIIASLSGAKEGDFVVIHACCHNPTGIDLSEPQMAQLAEAINDKRLYPILDAAYLGFKNSIESDAAALASLMQRFDTAFCAFSASKNFALYRERVGAAYVKGGERAKLGEWRELLLSLARSNYSMPPDHGASIVRIILEDERLRKKWLGELAAASGRLRSVREEFAKCLTKAGCGFSTDYIRTGSGLFCLLPLSEQEVRQLRVDNGIYMMKSGRVNLAGLRDAEVERVAGAIAAVVRSRARTAIA